MLTHEQVRELERFDSGGAPVLSVYLDLDEPRLITRAYEIAFEDLVKEAAAGLDESQRDGLAAEAARVQSWFTSTEVKGRSLTLFSCSARGLWQTYSLRVPMRDHLAYRPNPDVAPLLNAMDEYERYAVALVDKRDARLFTVFMGEIEESETIRDDVPGRHDQGGHAQARMQRHHETLVHWHLKHVARRLSDLLRQYQFDRLIIAGPDEPATELRGILPRPLAERVADVVPAEVFATKDAILEKTLEVERRMERDYEIHLVETLLETAGAGGRASCGVAPTLEALWLGEVRTLVVANGLRLSGSRCSNCGRLEAGLPDACPACGSPVQPADDIVHRAMGITLDQAGTVEVVRDEAARRLQTTSGGLAAMLRFRVSLNPPAS
jgi:hypothetical protein